MRLGCWTVTRLCARLRATRKKHQVAKVLARNVRQRLQIQTDSRSDFQTSKVLRIETTRLIAFFNWVELACLRWYCRGALTAISSKNRMATQMLVNSLSRASNKSLAVDAANSGFGKRRKLVATAVSHSPPRPNREASGSFYSEYLASLKEKPGVYYLDFPSLSSTPGKHVRDLVLPPRRPFLLPIFPPSSPFFLSFLLLSPRLLSSSPCLLPFFMSACVCVCNSEKRKKESRGEKVKIII